MTTLSSHTLKAICQGAFGAMTFGAYNLYTNNKITELYLEKQDIHHKISLE